ncbi:MAG: hypothetical protein ACKO0Z_25555, partial [Betaproteobacteria bacterium]
LSSVAYNATAANGSIYVYVDYGSAGMASGSSITVTAGAAQLTAASAFYVDGLTATNLVGAVVTATGSSATPTATKTGLTVSTNYLGLAFLGVQGTTADTFTQVSGWAAPPTRISSTGGNVTTNGMIEGGCDAFTAAATSITYNPTITSRPWAEILAVFTTATTVSVNTDESGSVIDSADSNASILSSSSESGSLNALVDNNISTYQLTSESVAAASAQLFQKYLYATDGESVSGLDTSSTQFMGYSLISEQGAVADLGAAVASFVVSRAEVSSSSDSSSNSVVTAVLNAESVSASTAVQTVLQAVGLLQETAAASHNQSNTAIIVVDSANPTTADSTASTILWAVAQAAEAANAAGTPSNTMVTAPQSIFEVTAVGASQSFSLSTPANTYELVSLANSQTNNVAFSAQVYDAIAAAELVTTFKLRPVSLTQIGQTSMVIATRAVFAEVTSQSLGMTVTVLRTEAEAQALPIIVS